MRGFQARKRESALRLHQIGAIQFGAFKLNKHKTYPDAPLSPVYVNLRTTDHPKNPGPLKEHDTLCVSELLYETAVEYGFASNVVAGVPDAATPFASLLPKVLANHGYRGTPKEILPLKKIKDESGDRILLVNSEYMPTGGLLLFDDVVTDAGRKLDAIQALRQGGVLVSSIVVVVDREQGGAAQIRERGISFAAAFTMSELLELYLNEGLIDTQMVEAVRSYQRRDQEYMAAQQMLQSRSAL
ncbi:hypothetical protein GF380_02940 [Candidatus Uhrbacteria bacterium]|nr:hypothetical protein [Candidatus Uhrbacteria bacterium]MBD3284105.1 hypothetical protein [Candidatus Uhrbacteria bacterium]